MTIDPGRVLADTWALWKRERALLLPVAGLFLFLPQLAQMLLIPAAPPWPGRASPEAMLEWFEVSYTPWVNANGPWIILGYLVVLFGSATILTLFLDPGRLDLRAALRRALALFLRYVLASFLVGLPIGAGLYVFVLPGIYLLGRLMLAGPAVVATPRLGAVRAAVTSWKLTRGRTLPLAALAALSMLASMVLPAPFLALAAALEAAGAVNPVAMAVLDVCAAAAASAAILGLLLVEVAVWRRIGHTA